MKGKKLPLLTILCLTILTVLVPVRHGAFAQCESRAEAAFSKMTLEEKIAQLMIIRASSTGGESAHAALVAKVGKFQPGGVCFFQGNPVCEAKLTNRIQEVSKVPMFISIDGEWGPAMRLDSCVAFPRQMTLGALSAEDDSLIYQMGLEVAKQCRAIGVNLNFAPVVDINNNAKNPVINSRSFGENRDKVVSKAALYLQGMIDGGISGCIKHFPGHGDTETDSHLGLPTIKKSRIELDELELYPYRKLINQNAEMIMVGHLNIPALDTTPKSVSSLSFPIVSELLKRDYGYTGLIVTDGMEMQGVRRQNQFEGDVEIQALLAGVDLLLLPGETEAVIHSIKNAIDSGIIPIELINERCMRILEYKESKGFLDFHPVDVSLIPQEMNSPNAVRINDLMEQRAVTLLKNEDGILPLSIIPGDTLTADSIAFLCIGRDEYQKSYRKIVSSYPLPYISLPKNISAKDYEKDKELLMPYNRVIVAYGGSNQLAASQYGADRKTIQFLNELAAEKRVILIHLGNPYVLSMFDSLTDYEAVLVTYQATPNSMKTALDACFGNAVCKGTLPVSNNMYPSGSGITGSIQEENLSALTDSITRILDALLSNGIQNKVYPGCVVLALKDGRPIYHKAFGNFTYDNQNRATLHTMYDLASITKTAATTLAVMKLYDEQKFQLTDPIGKYLPYLNNTNKAHITIVELLTHTSGLPAFIPFYKKIQNDETYLRHYRTPNFDIKVADNLYLRNDYPDTMRYRIAHCVLGRRQYLYSDLNALLLKDLVEALSGQALEDFLDRHFYHPMGLTHTCFQPLNHGFTKADVAPTEKDVDFRKQVVQGYVHDQTAALMNGNAGNAGLFSTAEELGDIYQMLLDKGMFHGTRYLSEKTVELFTSAYEIHGGKIRGLGFHTPKHPGNSSILPKEADHKTFGHQGFTGTVVWCDPDQHLVYVFLSNRVYPSCTPNKLSQSKIRLTAHEIIYKALLPLSKH